MKSQETEDNKRRDSAHTPPDNYITMAIEGVKRFGNEFRDNPKVFWWTVGLIVVAIAGYCGWHVFDAWYVQPESARRTYLAQHPAPSPTNTATQQASFLVNETNLSAGSTGAVIAATAPNFEVTVRRVNFIHMPIFEDPPDSPNGLVVWMNILNKGAASSAFFTTDPIYARTPTASTTGKCLILPGIIRVSDGTGTMLIDDRESLAEKGMAGIPQFTARSGYVLYHFPNNHGILGESKTNLTFELTVSDGARRKYPIVLKGEKLRMAPTMTELNLPGTKAEFIRK